MALAAACAHVGRASGHAFTAVTVDHGLQEGSAAIAARAVAAVQALGLPARTVRVDVARTGGPEAAGRAAAPPGPPPPPPPGGPRPAGLLRPPGGGSAL
ncbi:hypothetical protein GSY69_10630, partial [Brevibacterium sp. 5221]|nr:hypothetical protein [Brevibacterium rongguiense]